MPGKELKKRAKMVLGDHYLLFVAVCLIAAFLGTEFSLSLNAVTLYTEDFSVPADPSVVTHFLSRKNILEVVTELATGNREERDRISDEIIQDAIGYTQTARPVLEGQQGVLATIINSAYSGSFLVTILTALNSILGSSSAGLILLIIVCACGMGVVWFFLNNMFSAVSRRIFLEARQYQKISIQRFLYFFRVRRWAKVSWTLFVTACLKFLWALTIIGGFIKHYSYYLVPYLVAENPDIDAVEAITLSRKMMNGHKWEFFLFEITFIGWDLLGLLTFGAGSILFANPYKVASFCEYYALLRAQALEKNIPGCHLLNDSFLFQRPDRVRLEASYADVLEILQKPEPQIHGLKGFSGFLSRNFGVLLADSPEARRYEEGEAARIRIRALRDAACGLSYPDRLSPISEPKKLNRTEPLNYMRHYSIWSLLALFFILSFAGWIWEVALQLVTEHRFINRGVLHGPWLPIYGSGSLLILTALYRLRKRPVLEFFSAMTLCGIIEFMTVYILELTHNGQRWWDYRGYFLNLHGRICAESLLVFGLGGVLIVYILAPLLDNFLRRISSKILIPLCLVLCVLFVSDLLYSIVQPNHEGSVPEEQIVWIQPAAPKSSQNPRLR